MEAKQLPLPRRVSQKLKEEQRSKPSLAARRDGMAMAVDQLKESIGWCTTRANQLQESITSQQKELAEVLALLRKQDQAAKLLATYAAEGVNNPLVVVQEVHEILK
jgi:hypothetical protein